MMKAFLTRATLAVQAAFAVLSSAVVLFAPSAALAASVTRYPVSDGFYQQWTPSSGTAHWNKVDESSCNGNTDYVYYPDLTTASKADSYVLDISSIPNGSTITKIVITPCASRNDMDVSTSTILNVFYRIDSSNGAPKGDYALSGTTPTVLSASSWDVSIAKNSGTDMEVGISFWGGSGGAKVSNLKTVIHYQ